MREMILSALYSLNPEVDGTSRTVKAVMYKVSCANFMHTNDWGATGAMHVYETR